MVSAPAVADAIARAKNLPELNVGLHLVLSNGKATLPASEIPALVNSKGDFETNQVSSGIKMFFSAEAKTQLEKEIRAQFEAFKVTGLRLDHVNAHKHARTERSWPSLPMPSRRRETTGSRRRAR